MEKISEMMGSLSILPIINLFASRANIYDSLDK